MTKRIAALITLFAMLLMAGSLAIAEKSINEDEEIRGDFIYQRGTNKILAYIGDGGICEVPENAVLGGIYNVRVPHGIITKLIINKDVDFHSLNGLEGLKEIEFKEGVTEIPNGTLAGCPDLEAVTFPSTLKKIGDRAFSECSRIKSIDLPEGLEYIGEEAFSDLPSLSGDIIIPDTVTFMGYEAFAYCGDLDKVHISDNVTFVHEKPDNYASWDYTTRWFARANIKEINIPDSMLDNPVGMYYADEITFNSDMTAKIYKAVEDSSWCNKKYLKGKTDKSMGGYDGFAIADNTVLRYVGVDKNPVVPEGVKAIGEDAFRYCDVDSVTLPESLEEIKEGAFDYCTLKSIVIPENVKKIGMAAFQDCYLLSSLTFKGEPELDGNAVVISDVLTEDNIIFEKQSDKLLEKIYSWGIASDTEDALPGFYMIINDNREAMGWEAIPVPEEYREIDPKTGGKIKSTAEPEAAAMPQTTEEPQISSEPPEQEKRQLTVKSGDNLTISIGDKEVEFPDAQPFIDDNDRTQIPIRAVADVLNCDVDWDKETRTVTITRDNGGIVILTIDSSIMNVNDNAIQMDTSAIIKDDRTYIPIRFVAEAMGLTVEWYR